MDYEGKKVLVVGMARSGVAAAQLLRASGAEVTVNDSKTEAELGAQLAPLEGLQLERKFGCGAMELLEGMDCLVISPGIPDTAPFVVQAKEKGIYEADSLSEVGAVTIVDEGNFDPEHIFPHGLNGAGGVTKVGDVKSNR